MKRILGGAAVALVLVLAVIAIRVHQRIGDVEVAKVTDDVHAIYGFGSNVGVLRTDRGAVVVDTMTFRRQGVRIRELAEELGGGPVQAIVNTHYHFDHIGGNERYAREGAEVIAHENLWTQALKDTVIADYGDWHRKAAPAGAKPTRTFADTLRLDHEGDPVVLSHVPAAHSDNDVMVSFPRHNVLHTGDVVEIGAAPFVDLWAGGTVGGMINGIDRFLRASNDETRIVPGHGSIITRAELREYRAMLATLANRAVESIAEGRDLEGFLALAPAAQFEDRLGGARGARNLSALLFYGLNGMKREAAAP